MKTQKLQTAEEKIINIFIENRSLSIMFLNCLTKTVVLFCDSKHIDFDNVFSGSQTMTVLRSEDT